MSADTIASLHQQLVELKARVAQLEARDRRVDRLSLVVFSGTLDHQLAAFSLATAV